MITSSPSWRNFRETPCPRSNGLVPFQQSSNMEPYESGVWKGKEERLILQLVATAILTNNNDDMYMILKHEIHVFEPRIETNFLVNDPY